MKLTVCLYVLFIMVVLSISFPLKSPKNKITANQNGANGIGLANDIDDSDLSENEQKLLQRARDLPIINNRSYILRDAFKK